MLPSKESWFFSHYFDEGSDWLKHRFSHCEKHSWKCDFCSTGFFRENFFDLLESTIGDEAKFIVMLRDPIERFVSHYQHEVRLGRETRPLSEVIVSELQAPNSSDWDQAYLRIGAIYEELITNLRINRDAANVLILTLEDFKASSHFNCKAVLADFLGLNSERGFSSELPLLNIARKRGQTSFIGKAFMLPLVLYSRLQNVIAGYGIIPDVIVSKSRTLRGRIFRTLESFSEHGVTPVSKPVLTDKELSMLRSYYRSKLSDLDTATGRSITKYWTWW